MRLIGYIKEMDSLVISKGIGMTTEIRHVGLYSTRLMCYASCNPAYVLYIHNTRRLCVCNIYTGIISKTSLCVTTDAIIMAYSVKFSTIYILYPANIQVYRFSVKEGVCHVKHALHIDTPSHTTNVSMSVCVNGKCIMITCNDDVIRVVYLRMDYDKDNAMDFFSGLYVEPSETEEYHLWAAYRQRLLHGGFGYTHARPEFRKISE
jgi:hypothetical protein